MTVLATDSEIDTNTSIFLKLADNADIRAPSLLQDSSKTFQISDLLPYSLEKKHHSKLSGGLKEYRMLLLAAEQALELFQAGELSNFDSLVGENSCQIRATMISLIANEPRAEINSILTDIRYNLKRIDLINESPKNLSSQTTALKAFLEQNLLHVKISYRTLFLISSYILTKVRVLLPPNPTKRIVRNESTDTRKIKEISPVGSSFARELVKKLRNIVSTSSVSFVQDIADILNLPESIQSMVSDQYCLSHDKFGRLKCLPSFWYTMVLVKYSVIIELPIVLKISQIASDTNHQKINETTFYFKVVDGNYRLVSPNQFPKNAPALIVLGSCCRKLSEFPELDTWKKEILRYDPKDLLLAYAAAHRQYPDESKDVLIGKSPCQAYNSYKSKAQEWGCSLQNPSLFFLVHAYCDKIKNINSFTTT